MRTLVLAAAIAIAGGSSTARADVALGVFLGQPTGVDLKIGVDRYSALDIVFGWSDIWRDGRDEYAHLTYLFTPVVGRGDAVLVPLRIGLGIAFYGEGSFGNGVNLAARVPVELALKFRRMPLELYGELAAELTFYDDNNNNEFFDVQGGAGLRVYF
jgi:hypothetical protein